jgi:hypothetical protein
MRPLSHKLNAAARALARGLSVTAAAKEAGLSRERLSRAVNEQSPTGDLLRSEVARLRGQDPGGDPLQPHRARALEVLRESLDSSPPASRGRLAMAILQASTPPPASPASSSTATPRERFAADAMTSDQAFAVVAQTVEVLAGVLARGRQPSAEVLDRFRRACVQASQVQPGPGIDRGAPVPPSLPPEVPSPPPARPVLRPVYP